MSHRFLLVDVFTDTPFGGNQLAVFPDAADIPEDRLQRIARELNLPETAYVYPSRHAEAAARLRIFAPDAEVPFAGHPVVGTAFALAHEHRLAHGGATEVGFELECGIVPVHLDLDDEGVLRGAVMTQQRPVFLGEFRHRHLVAAALGLDTADIDITGLPCEVVSTGLPFHIVPVGDLEAIGRIRLAPDRLDEITRLLGFQDLFVFTFDTVDPESDVHCRMFAPSFGIPEDPATGSASGSLGAYLVKNKVVPPRAITRIVSEQGLEIGRRSRVNVEVETLHGHIVAVRVGGAAVVVGEGRFFC